MKKTRMPQRLLALVLVLMMLISVLPVSAMAAELTPADARTGLTATDVTISSSAGTSDLDTLLGSMFSSKMDRRSLSVSSLVTSVAVSPVRASAGVSSAAMALTGRTLM